MDPVVADPNSTPLTSALIKSITLQAEDGIAISSDSDGVVRTWDISTGLCNTSFQTMARNYDVGDVWMIDGRLTFVWMTSMELFIWDVENSILLEMMDGPADYVEDLRISEDGSIIFFLHWSFAASWEIL